MTGPLGQRVQEYLRLRRALGFRLEREGQVLPQFAVYLEQAGAATVTADHAIAWAQLPRGVDPVNWTHRLTAVRSFAAWLRTIDPAAEIPPRGVFPGQRPRMRAATYTALFGLIAVTGIRIGEALALPVTGADLDAGLLSVSPAKSRCERILPLHPSTVEALAGYARLRDRKHPAARTFFVSIRGTALCYGPVLQAFRQACAGAGLDGPGARPRIHDLRHAFAVTTLLQWYRSGEDIAAQMPALSGYLGHVSPEGTYWYISAVPELMQLAAARLAREEDRDE
jgi:integrase